MPGAYDVACADNPDPQLATVFLGHVSNADVDLVLSLTIARAKF
jgi:hypothetical protein